MKKHWIFILGTILFLAACSGPQKNENTAQAFAQNNSWANNAVLYEVNVRQYSPEGTFNAFAKDLPRIKELGVDILWIMPIHPISVKNRKGTLGSYYSVADYKKINPEFGTIDDFKSLVNKSHEMGMKVIIDWVANHTGWDNPWIYEHPDWYTTDSTGAIIAPNPDWSDIADLNFDVPEMRRAMIDAMDFWLRETDIDGFRCDVAWGVPADFWDDARASFDSIKPVYMLAEDEDHPAFLNTAFESNYAWQLHHIINDVAQGKKDVTEITSYFEKAKNKYPARAFPMQFITNHDENSWAGSVSERLGDAANAFAVFSFTVPGIPLIYSGQEAGMSKRLEFFEKDQIDWSRLNEVSPFYQQLTQLKHQNKAFSNGIEGGSFTMIGNSQPEKLFAFVREKENNKVLVLLNLSDKKVSATLNLQDKFVGNEYFTGEETDFEAGKPLELAPWSYKIVVQK